MNRKYKNRVLPNNEEEEEEEERGDKGNGSPFCSHSPCKTDSLPVLLTRPECDQQQGPPLLLLLSGRPCSSPSLSSVATRAPASSSSSALLPAPRRNTEKGTAPTRKLALRCSLLPTKHTAVVIGLLSWALFFSVGTVRRCKEWNSERVLFESALEVCPDGIKTLNNVAVGMLNEEEAGRAEVLLRRAVEVGF